MGSSRDQPVQSCGRLVREPWHFEFNSFISGESDTCGNCQFGFRDDIFGLWSYRLALELKLDEFCALGARIHHRTRPTRVLCITDWKKVLFMNIGSGIVLILKELVLISMSLWQCVLSLNQLKGVFYLMIFGIVFGILLIIVEKILFYLANDYWKCL